MKILMALTFLTILVSLVARETRTEIINASNPADNGPNSNKVPAAYAIEGKFDRILVLRLKYQTDLLGGLESVVKEQKIRNAVILAGAGSVRSYHFHTVSNREFPSKNIHVNNPTGPADVASMNGYVIDGRVHAHVTFANEKKAFGGHLEPGTSVFTFAIVTLGVFEDGIDLRRMDDKTYR